MDISVIICTHNPRKDYLVRVLEALKMQTLPSKKWELLLIDNASQEPLATKWDLSWHPQFRHIREEKLGLTAARMRGITESVAEILIFVDDDNVLNADYLEQVVNISIEFPKIGVWGGSITGIFEIEPPDFVRPHLDLLAIGEVAVEAWGTIKGFNAACSPGAGMVVRKKVALDFQLKVLKDPMRLYLGRKGGRLTSGEDIDLAWSACDMGYGMGRFKKLKLQHYIAAKRLTIEYFEQLIEGGAYSNVFLYHFHGIYQRKEAITLWSKLRRLKQYVIATREDRIFARAANRGTKCGLLALEQALLLEKLEAAESKKHNL